MPVSSPAVGSVAAASPNRASTTAVLPTTRLSTYSVPLTWLPAAPDGVMVTGMVTVCPGWTVTSGSAALGVTELRHRSPAGDVTVESKPWVNAVMASDTVPLGQPFAPAVPSSAGAADQ